MAAPLAPSVDPAPTATTGRGALRWTDRLVLALTSALGLGYAPVAPGTFGTLAGLPLWFGLAQLELGWQGSLAVLTGATAVASWLSHRAEAIYGAHDVQKIVLDEVVGFLWSVYLLECTWRIAILAFVGFRLFDALKPGPVGVVDRRVGGGLGVVLDDVVAGLLTCLVLHFGRALHLWPFVAGA